MSDEEEHDVDIESEIDEDDENGVSVGRSYYQQVPAQKRAHHNALERKRRDHIKESFHGLRDSIPALQGEKSSRAQILKQATDYITMMSQKNHRHQTDIEDLKHQNTSLEQQLKKLEKSRTAGAYSLHAYNNVDEDDSDSSDVETESPAKNNRRKKQKT